MNNFKSGSGDLDFGGTDGDDEEETPADQSAPTGAEESSEGESPPRSASGRDSEGEQTRSPPDEYPYFVRRSNVGDERDNRLEIHVRDDVAEREAAFRSRLADHLGTDEVTKTDAREFALLAAFDDPERVAERMEEEGFGILD